MTEVYQVPGEVRPWLVNQDETGMGYQLLAWPSPSYALVVSSHYVITFSSKPQLFEGLQTLQARFGESDELDEGPSRSFMALTDAAVVDRNSALARKFLRSGPEVKTAQNSIELVHNIPSIPQPRMFFRFGATKSDPRVMPDGSFVKGTYATTYNDLRMVPSGLAAVGRYALPVPASARYVRSIVTREAHSMGTALPNFSQSGGGVEVKFANLARALHQDAHPIDIG